MSAIDDMISRLGTSEGATEAIAALTALRLEALPAILEYLKRPRGRQGVDDALEVLFRMGPDIAPHLIEALRGDEALRGPLAWVLGEFKSKEAIECLREMMQSDDVWHRRFAGKALDRIGASHYPPEG